MKNFYNIIWLWLSSFGIMFAILSFLTEIHIFKNIPTYKKGLTAIITATILFFISFKLM